MSEKWYRKDEIVRALSPEFVPLHPRHQWQTRRRFTCVRRYTWASMCVSSIPVRVFIQGVFGDDVAKVRVEKYPGVLIRLSSTVALFVPSNLRQSWFMKTYSWAQNTSLMGLILLYESFKVIKNLIYRVGIYVRNV